MSQQIQALYDAHIPKKEISAYTREACQALYCEERHIFGYNSLLDTEISLEACKARRFFALLDWKSQTFGLKQDSVVNLRVELYCQKVAALQLVLMHKLWKSVQQTNKN